VIFSPGAVVRALSTMEASAGQAVSATKVEISTAEAMTKPNSVKSLPAAPLRNEIGTNTAISVTDVAMMAKVT